VIPVNQMTIFIHQDHAISVAVKGDGKVGLMFGKQGCQSFRLGTGIFRTGMHIDVDPVRFCIQCNNFSA